MILEKISDLSKEGKEMEQKSNTLLAMVWGNAIKSYIDKNGEVVIPYQWNVAQDFRAID